MTKRSRSITRNLQAALCRRRFLNIELALHVLGDLLHYTPLHVVQFLGPISHDYLVANEYEYEGLIAMFLVLVYPWAIIVFIWVIYLSDRYTSRGFWKSRKKV